ncbi:hypothetical protein Tco_1579180, partial [Tanacetum coccineum]
MLEKVKQEKDGIDFKIKKLEKASKDLDQLLGSQITNKCKKGLGYSAVPPPHPLIYNRPNKLDLSYSGLDEFKEPEFKDNSKENSVESLVEEQVSQDKSSFVETSPNVDKETIFPVNKKVNTVRPRVVNTARPNTTPVNTVRVKRVNAVKSSTYWVWRPTKLNGASLAFKRHNYIDARGRSNGCSSQKTRNITYLSDFKEFNRGYVAFGGGAYGGRITGKGILKTD